MEVVYNDANPKVKALSSASLIGTKSASLIWNKVMYSFKKKKKHGHVLASLFKSYFAYQI